MCGRFSQSEHVDRIAEIFGAERDRALPDGSYNVAPTDRIRILVERDAARRLVVAEWGFRPFWRHGRTGWINARAETVLESPAFAPALRRHRCVIPADAFYEWDRGHRPPQPYAIGPTGAGEFLALAGLWTEPRDGDAPTATILTTGPNRLMEPLHHRMPVILAAEDVDAWLAEDAPLDEVMPLLVPAPEEALRVWAVSTAVNRVGTNGPELLRPFDAAPATLGLL